MRERNSEAFRPVVLALFILFLIALVVMRIIQWRIPEDQRPQAAPLPSLDEYLAAATPKSDPFESLDTVSLGSEEQTNQEATILARDAETLSVRVSKPAGDGPFPVMVMVHGIDSSSQITTQVSLQYGKQFADELHAIVVVPDWRQSTIGEDDFIDVVSAVDWAQSITERGDKPVILFGMDRGAYLALKATNEVSVDGVVSAYGYVDLLEQYHSLQESNPESAGVFLSGTGCSTVVDVDGCLRQLSITNILDIQVPTLIIHGADDQVTPPHQSELLQDAIDPQYVRFELMDGATDDEQVARVFDDSSVTGHDAAMAILYRWLQDEFTIDAVQQ